MVLALKHLLFNIFRIQMVLSGKELAVERRNNNLPSGGAGEPSLSNSQARSSVSFGNQILRTHHMQEKCNRNKMRFLPAELRVRVWLPKVPRALSSSCCDSATLPGREELNLQIN